jgi:two-component system chemotaxis response regulator CheY
MVVSKKPSVLVADDDRSMRELLKVILSSEDYPIAGEVSNGVDAVMKCVELKPDIVLLDINMPKMDGIQALEEIRKARPSAMVLMVSGDVRIDRVKEALAKGAAGFIVKPLKPASVLDRISSCWKTKNSHGK